ncbi:protein of unknown function [Candidatus Nitrotoga arctica]|uniref:Uncharacterized protein n=1 Tax=Candidatus Nitrotoga arctica TaxID=453162 RepID=A0ABM8YWT5_9PROT|nr:protein of unknown function [Candidatus Nitrotoga arctica]
MLNISTLMLELWPYTGVIKFNQDVSQTFAAYSTYFIQLAQGKLRKLKFGFNIKIFLRTVPSWFEKGTFTFFSTLRL